MDFLYRSKPPTYQGAGQAQPTAARTGLLHGIWCAVFGGLFNRSTPSYRTKGSALSTAATCGGPPYQAPSEGPPSDPRPDAPPGEPTGEDCGCDPPYEPREIHIYPGG